MIRYIDKDRHNDFTWFVKHYDEFYKQYGVSHIAIRHQEILGVFDTDTEGIDSLAEIYPLGTYSLQYCNGDESGYTGYIYSPKIARMVLGL